MLAARVAQEMQRLSSSAFSMINRGLQWVTEGELDAIQAAPRLGRPGLRAAVVRAAVSAADSAVRGGRLRARGGPGRPAAAGPAAHRRARGQPPADRAPA